MSNHMVRLTGENDEKVLVNPDKIIGIQEVQNKGPAILNDGKFTQQVMCQIFLEFGIVIKIKGSVTDVAAKINRVSEKAA